jgi:hypothetical protein
MNFDYILPFEYDKWMLALNSPQKKALEMSENSKNRRQNKDSSSLSISKKCIINKLDMLTNATVVEYAMQFVQQSKEKL